MYVDSEWHVATLLEAVACCRQQDVWSTALVDVWDAIKGHYISANKHIKD